MPLRNRPPMMALAMLPPPMNAMRLPIKMTPVW
jgi:hypothetical protein